MGLLSNAAESNQGDSVRPFAPWELPIEKHLTVVMAAPGSQSGGGPALHAGAARRLHAVTTLRIPASRRRLRSSIGRDEVPRSAHSRHRGIRTDLVALRRDARGAGATGRDQFPKELGSRGAVLDQDHVGGEALVAVDHGALEVGVGEPFAQDVEEIDLRKWELKHMSL